MALNYFSVTKPAALSVAMNSSTTVVALVDASSFPDPAGPGNGQYTVIIGYGSDREEVCTVTAKSGNSLTVIRGQDSTAATGKNQGDVVVHGVSARDFKSFAKVDDPPLLHATSHAIAGTDRVTPAMIGAPTDAQVAAVVNQAVPIGTIIMWGGAAPPTGYHPCDGSAHGSTALQNAIGSANTPDMRGLFIVGAGKNADATLAAGDYVPGTGAKVGKEFVTLTIAEMPTHSHGGITSYMNTDPSHAHAISTANPQYQGFDITVGGFGDKGVNAPGPGYTDPVNIQHQHGVLAEGGGQRHENRPPYYAVTFAIRKA